MEKQKSARQLLSKFQVITICDRMLSCVRLLFILCLIFTLLQHKNILSSDVSHLFGPALVVKKLMKPVKSLVTDPSQYTRGK